MLDLAILLWLYSKLKEEPRVDEYEWRQDDISDTSYGEDCDDYDDPDDDIDWMKIKYK